MNRYPTSVIREPLQKLLARLPAEDHPLVGEAYHLASASHEGQHRDEGQPYITHPIYVAMILASELGFYRDEQMMVAALLHDAVEDSALGMDDITPMFGEAVAVLVRGVTKVEEARGRSRASRRAATLQRLFSAAHEDPRVLILKLADRIHNMRSIDGIRDAPRVRRIAQETVDVYIPLCHLMGIGKVRRELEDRCLECLEPRVYSRLVDPQIEVPPVLESFVAALDEALHDQGIRTRLRIHPRHATSLYRTLRRASLPPEKVDTLEVFDRYSVEVIASNRDSCYRALGTIHSRFVPVMEGFRDFIALPKRNGYRALHTRVQFEDHQFEIHTKTPSMHRMGELGITTLRGDRIKEQRRMRWLHELVDWQEVAEDKDGEAGGTSTQLLNELKRILFVQEIVVFTPKRDPVILPAGASLLDFAFAVHTDLGLRCTGGQVNAVQATPSSPLDWGDSVEVTTSEKQTPKEHWLRFVKTYRARRVIKRALSRSESG